MHKIMKMLIATLTAYNPLIETQLPFTRFLKGHDAISWDLSKLPPPNVIMGLYARLQFMPAHFMLTFKEAFHIGFFESLSHIFGPLNPEHHIKWVAYTRQELQTELPQLLVVTLKQLQRQRELLLACNTLQRHHD